MSWRAPGTPTKLCRRGLRVRSINYEGPCGQCAAADALEDATVVVAALVPIPAGAVRELVAVAAWTGEQRRCIAAHLRSHPDALRSGATGCPPALVRLARLLSRDGIAGVVVPGKERRLCPAGRHGRSGWTHPGVACGRCEAEAALDDVVRLVAERLPALTTEAVAGIVSKAAHTGDARRRLASHLRAHPDALRSGDSEVPLVVVRLVNVLIDGGVDGVKRLHCAGCDRPRRRLHIVARNGRLCECCRHRRHTEPCIRCGRSLPVAGRDARGRPLCCTCRTKDPSSWESCSRCGRRGPVVARMDTGPIGRCCYVPPVIRCTVCGLAKGTKPWKTRRPVCPDCRAVPTVACSVCGRDAPVLKGDDAPVCAVCRTNPGLPCRECGRPTPARDRYGAPRCFDCYRRPAKACGRCGRIRPVVRLARDGEPDLCAVCWTGPTVACESCGEVRPCRGERRQRMLCSKCCPIAPQPCAHCGRLRRVTANWTEGPICQACYGRALAAKATCPRCGSWRRLRTYPEFADKVCSDCAGAEPYSVCRTCGVEDYLYDKGRCPACALAARLDDLFGADGKRGKLQPVYEVLRTLERPRDVIRWLQKSRVTALLHRLATGELPVSFAALDGLPRSPSVWFVEHLLTTTGVLPGRDPILARFELWVADWLESVGGAEHERLLRRFATWEVLRPLRSASTRRHLSDHQHNAAKDKLKAAHRLLDFLARRGRSLSGCRQADLDAWGADVSDSWRKDAQGFFSWAVRHNLAPSLLYPPRAAPRDPNIVFGDGEWTLARRLLHEDGFDLRDRVAGLLVLLYAQTPARISRLTAEDVAITETSVLLRPGRTPVRIPPPMAEHVRVLLLPRSPTSVGKIGGVTHWLFPGHRPGRPVHTHVLAGRLRDLGVRASTDRPSALAHLAATMPAAIVADLLGVSAQTAVAWAEAAARTRADYVSHL